jgi:hypothetical protein
MGELLNFTRHNTIELPSSVWNGGCSCKLSLGDEGKMVRQDGFSLFGEALSHKSGERQVSAWSFRCPKVVSCAPQVVFRF